MGSEPNDQLEVVQLLYMNLFIYLFIFTSISFICMCVSIP